MRRRISGLGADQSMYDMFDSQLNSYKTLLVSLYRKKTKAVAERESLRFQYLTGMKAKLSNIFSAIYSQLFSELNSNGEELTRIIIGYIQAGIPMVSLNGGNIQGWASNPNMVGGRLALGYLSPMTHFLSEPFYDPGTTDQRPAYKIYSSNYLSVNNNACVIVAYYFLGNSTLYGSAELQGHTFEFSVPPSEEWTLSFLRQRYSSKVQQLISAYPYMVDIITRTYPAGKLPDAVEEAKTMLFNIVQKTKSIIQLQLDIDQSEGDLADFVSEYKDYLGSDQTLESLLAQLKAESEKSESLPLPPATSDYSVTATTVAVPGADDLPSAPVMPAQKSKLPWIAAAAAIVYMMKGK